MMVRTSTLVTATTFVSAVPVKEVTVAVTVRVVMVVESGESRAASLLHSAPESRRDNPAGRDLQIKGRL